MNIRIRAMLICALLAAPLAHGQDVRAGLWNITLSMTAAGTPQDFGPFSKTQCFTEDDVRDPGRLFGEIGAECAYGDRQYHGNQFNFTIQCGGALPLRGSGSVRYSPDHFEGDMQLNASVPGGGQVGTRSRVSGNRIGDC